MRRAGYRTRDRRDDLTPRPTDEEHVLGRTTDPAELAECLVSLDEESRCAVCRYWEQVIGEEWVAVSPVVPRAVPVAGVDGRRGRRVVARVAAAGRAARVHVPAAPTAAGAPRPPDVGRRAGVRGAAGRGARQSGGGVMWVACGVDDGDPVTVTVSSDSAGRLVHVGLGELRLVLTLTRAEQLGSRLVDALTGPGPVTAECLECGHPIPLGCSPDPLRCRQCTDRLDWCTGRAQVRA